MFDMSILCITFCFYWTIKWYMLTVFEIFSQSSESNFILLGLGSEESLSSVSSSILEPCELTVSGLVTVTPSAFGTLHPRSEFDKTAPALVLSVDVS